MKSLTQDAKGFVAGVITQIRKTGNMSDASGLVQSLLLKMTKNARKERQAIVESAVKLTASEQQDIERVLSKVSGHEVSLECRVEPRLIGGIRIQMADWVMDASMANELNEMAHILSLS